jgi:hypothetical protein
LAGSATALFFQNERLTTRQGNGFVRLFCIFALTFTIAFYAPAGVSFANDKTGDTPAAPSSAPSKGAAASETMTLDTFLDRLMLAESGGRRFAANPRSTALGPYQFIAATWLEVVNRSFADETEKLNPAQILNLRTNVSFARRVAKVYSQSNAAYLVANGFKATFPHLRLAFLVGPGGAARVLSAKPKTPVVSLLGALVINANPFMTHMNAAELIARAEHDISAEAGSQAGITPSADAIKAAKQHANAEPQIKIRCNLKRASCRHWLALAKRRAARRKQASRD